MTKLLFLAANPIDTGSLELEKEIVEVIQAVEDAKYGSQFEIIPKIAVKRNQFLRLLEYHKPHIIHFSGHGSSASELLLEDEYGNTQPIDKGTMKDIFSLVKHNTKCIVLNACYAEAQANLIAEEINGVVVGTTGEISDNSAIKFAKEFYFQIATGKDILYSYKAGRIQFEEGRDLLRIYNPNVNPSEIVFVNHPSNKVVVGLVAGGLIAGKAITIDSSMDVSSVPDVEHTDNLDYSDEYFDDLDDDIEDDFDDDDFDDDDDSDNGIDDDDDDFGDFDEDDFDDDD